MLTCDLLIAKIVSLQNDSWRMLSFEPFPENVKLFNASITINRLHDTLKLIPAAVTRATSFSPVRLYSSEKDSSVGVVLPRIVAHQAGLVGTKTETEIRTASLPVLLRRDSGTFGQLNGFHAIGARAVENENVSEMSKEMWKESTEGGNLMPEKHSQPGPKNSTKLCFLKIDVEGRDQFVLEGGQSILRADRPVVLAEVNPQNMRATQERNLSTHATLRFMTDQIAYRQVLPAEEEFGGGWMGCSAFFAVKKDSTDNATIDGGDVHAKRSTDGGDVHAKHSTTWDCVKNSSAKSLLDSVEIKPTDYYRRVVAMAPEVSEITAEIRTRFLELFLSLHRMFFQISETRKGEQPGNIAAQGEPDPDGRLLTAEEILQEVQQNTYPGLFQTADPDSDVLTLRHFVEETLTRLFREARTTQELDAHGNEGRKPQEHGNTTGRCRRLVSGGVSFRVVRGDVGVSSSERELECELAREFLPHIDKKTNTKGASEGEVEGAASSGSIYDARSDAKMTSEGEVGGAASSCSIYDTLFFRDFEIWYLNIILKGKAAHYHHSLRAILTGWASHAEKHLQNTIFRHILADHPTGLFSRMSHASRRSFNFAPARLRPVEAVKTMAWTQAANLPLRLVLRVVLSRWCVQTESLWRPDLSRWADTEELERVWQERPGVRLRDVTESNEVNRTQILEGVEETSHLSDGPTFFELSGRARRTSKDNTGTIGYEYLALHPTECAHVCNVLMHRQQGKSCVCFDWHNGYCRFFRECENPALTGHCENTRLVAMNTVNQFAAEIGSQDTLFMP